ncbi:hypothetical protein C7974DRAFT_378394 [Boeremia exigua]|uniref:uncharacterized protein n=1 Tax=Boeremia exigua TaxID=749465 RepID=UPI001E8E0835|nr:uncharacterized protein C7974DRAFT_378394 [Boeremia exigua]KAH6620329.1 hypothetical protein C7974DRAFT_378394 [Boeremia exigua]
MSSPPHNNKELPVIWLAPPAALSPSAHPIATQPLPIAISATLATLIIVTLIVLYNKKPKTPKPLRLNVSPATPRHNTHVQYPKPTHASRTKPYIPSVHPLPHIVANSVNKPTKSEATTASNTSSSDPPSQDTPVQEYHSYLRDSVHEESLRSAAASRSASQNSYKVPSYYENVAGSNRSVIDVAGTAPAADAFQTAASSDYSISIDPTPRPSRQNSFRRSRANGLWTRLRLGSEYDGDRTYVPSEADLRLA